ncbi:MAG: TIGR02186 family protein [Nitrospirae bacterium]|nr:TIGR02186 family protein [Nitrospirota bacterium]
MNFKLQISKFKITAFLFICCSAALLLCCAVSSAELTMDANHDHINIDFFYHGSEVSVKGSAAAGSELIVKIASQDGHQILKKKGKAAGFLWMNVGELKFEHTPSLYLIAGTKNPDDTIDREEMDRHVIGYQALERHVEINPVANADEKTRWFQEFVKFKESSNLYAVIHETIFTSVNGNRQDYSIKFAWPYQAAPGDYEVTVYAVRDRKITETASKNVVVEQVGIVKSLADMAKNNGALYGIVSIVIALGAGFGVGMIFRKGGGAH